MGQQRQRGSHRTAGIGLLTWLTSTNLTLANRFSFVALPSISRYHHNLTILQSLAQPILIQVLDRKVDQFGYVVNANHHARGRWSIRGRCGNSRGYGVELGRRIEEVIEDRYGVSRSGAYVENVCSRLDPWKEILAGMRVLSYHEMYGTAGSNIQGIISQKNISIVR